MTKKNRNAKNNDLNSYIACKWEVRLLFKEAGKTELATYFGYLSEFAEEEVWYRLPAVIGVLVLTQLLDTRFTKKKEYSNFRCFW